MSIPGVISSIKMSGLGVSFHYEENNSMPVETLEEYVSVSTEASYGNPGEHEPIGLMELGG